jgi:hypothetical protein
MRSIKYIYSMPVCLQFNTPPFKIKLYTAEINYTLCGHFDSSLIWFVLSATSFKGLNELIHVYNEFFTVFINLSDTYDYYSLSDLVTLLYLRPN